MQKHLWCHTPAKLQEVLRLSKSWRRVIAYQLGKFLFLCRDMYTNRHENSTLELKLIEVHYKASVKPLALYTVTETELVPQKVQGYPLVNDSV